MPEIAIVGEAWGQEEAQARTPFVGWSGRNLTAMLADAGINRADCLVTNVFQVHPPGNDLSFFCGTPKESIHGYPPLAKSKYVHRKWIPELERLRDEIVSCNPNIIIALGNTALWALCGKGAISKTRGYVHLSTHTVIDYKVLPTYHPAAVVRQWPLRTTVVLDFEKALREAAFPELRRPQRNIYIPETLDDLQDFKRKFLERAALLSVDIETAGRTITCIGFAPSTSEGLCVPFVRGNGRRYWADQQDEKAAWEFVRETCESEEVPKLFQNGLYDIAFLWRAVGIRVRKAVHDTMLLHHALQPETLKSLEFLGSVYTDEGPWKRLRGKVKTIKRDE